MTIEDLKAMLKCRQAVIVHCSRPGRGGEAAGTPIPLYPHDLIATISDLEKGGVRDVSCSVVWPDHQKTVGAVGIVLEPFCIEDITRMCPTDAGNIPGEGGFGEAPSIDAALKTFENSIEYNEWVITAAKVRGIFVNSTMNLEVAREIELQLPEGFSEDQRYLFGDSGKSVEPCSITLEQIRKDFPDFAVYSFVDGSIKKL